MSNNRLPLKINAASPLPINVQIKEQIKWLLGTNVIVPGDVLPSANTLADELKLNRNTIQWVYIQLQKEGLVEIQKGRGTKIVEGSKIEEYKRRNPYFNDVVRFIDKANGLGYSTDNVILAAFAYAQLIETPITGSPRLLFVECKQTDCLFYIDEIKRLTDAEVSSIDISESHEKFIEAAQGADVIVTTLAHAERVRKHCPSDKIILTISTPTDVTPLLNILNQSKRDR